MWKPVIFAFGHTARCGKDTAVNAIIAARGDKYDIRRYAFADALKEEIAGREFELCMKHNVKYEPDNKHRALLQWWGTEYRRAQDPYYWVNKVKDKISEDKPGIALISDLRFLNEAVFVLANDGITVNVKREGYVDLTAAQHGSEHELDRFDFDYDITVKDGEVEVLKQDALALFDEVVDALDHSNNVKELLDAGICTTSCA